jgi:hypothetical protein
MHPFFIFFVKSFREAGILTVVKQDSQVLVVKGDE